MTPRRRPRRPAHAPPGPVILASASPRRIELLAALGRPFRVLHSRFRESLPSLPAEEAARLLAWRKAETAGRRLARGLIVAADTIVALGDTLFGKPRSQADAAAQLRQLSGRTHEVVTAVALFDTRTRCGVLGSDQAFVTFRRLTAPEISRYVASGEPLDKAGSYGIQEAGGRLVAGLRGDRLTVVGFPVRLFVSLARRFGLRFPAAAVRRLYGGQG